MSLYSLCSYNGRLRASAVPEREGAGQAEGRGAGGELRHFCLQHAVWIHVETGHREGKARWDKSGGSNRRCTSCRVWHAKQAAEGSGPTECAPLPKHEAA